jgi:Helix-hairpin-helix motif
MEHERFGSLGKLARMALISIFAVSAMGILSLLTSCQSQPPSDEQVRQQAAQATERAKEGSKEVLQDARIAAANAERKVDDITAGVKDGMKNGDSAESRTNLNTASLVELALLPGVSVSKAKEIRDHRPYASPHQLVSRGVLTESEYGAISSKVTVQ